VCQIINIGTEPPVLLVWIILVGVRMWRWADRLPRWADRLPRVDEGSGSETMEMRAPGVSR
jgi:hypothetical protein